jgi:hypothetical protein
MKYREQIEAHLLKLAETGITGTKNKHMTHVEDLVILAGAEGIEHALDTFNSLYDELKGNTPKSERRVSVKIDGAPAVFVWNSFPGLPGPGLATKGLFAKTPKAAYNHELVDQYFGHAPDLAKKMHAMLDHIPELGVPEGQIWQGDFLYDKGSLNVKTIENEPHYIFHPNTIVYAVPVQSEIGARIGESDIGVVWHTVYTGDSVENVVASFSAKAESLNHVPGVFSTDPYIKSIAGIVTMTAEETAAMDKKLVEAEALAQQLISHPQYELVVDDEDFISSFFTVFQNDTIRRGKKVPDPETFIADFSTWALNKIRNKAEKTIAGLKTEKGQVAARQKMEHELQSVQEIIESSEDVLILIIELVALFTDIKETFTRKMDALGGFQAYLQMKSGDFRRTGQEGFAISDISGNVVKFVDRTEFSFANFSTDVEKGWENKRVAESRIRERGTADNPIYMDVANKIDSLVEPHGLRRRDFPTRKKANTFGAKIEAPPNVDRKKAAEDFIADLEKDDQVIILDKHIPLGKKRPHVLVDLEGTQLYLEFKDNAKTPSKLDAIQTAAMEISWARCMQAANADESFPTYDDLAQTFTKIDQDWYDGFIIGAKLVDTELLDPATPYKFFRGDTVIDVDGNVYKDASKSLHYLIDTTFQKRRDLFGHIGSKKDAWNPSDIYACRSTDHDSLVENWKTLATEAETVDDINSFLLTAQEQQSLIGISLKKPGKNPHLELANAEAAELPEYDYELQSVQLSLDIPPKLASASLKIRNTTNDSTILGSIRYFGETKKGGPFGASLALELKEQGASAQLGKVPTGIIRAWAADYGFEVPSKHDALGALANGLVDYIPMVQEIEQSGIDTSLTVQNFRRMLDKAESLYPEFFLDIANAGTAAEEAVKLAKTEKQREKAERAIVRQRAIDVFSTFIKVKDPEAERNLIYLSQLPQQIVYLATMAHAIRSGEAHDFFNDIVNGAKKIGKDNAPFVKVS